MSQIQESYTGQSGILYTTQEVLQEDETPPRRVCSSHDNAGRKYILKYIPEVNYSYLEKEIYGRLREDAKNVRIIEDAIPDKSMFVFKYFRSHFLGLVQQKNLPLDVTKTILKQALLGIAEMHDKEIVHSDIKADNILVDWEDGRGEIAIDQVKIADLEDAAYVPPNTAIVGKQAGNYMWRSPEAHASGPIGKPSDIFSFAIVMIYALSKRIIFHVTDEELDGGKLERIAIVIERQMSFFGEWQSTNEFIGDHLAPDNPYGQVFLITRDGFGLGTPRNPFRLSNSFDDDFKDLVVNMTDFNPAKRITAREALQHKWFNGV
ncbi:kinase-like protein [Cucurbitaria berberidis CBS 394.84]|uniref:Kinase-like protein n=1 Tax=Cucurbitaria berberidis CBS 394.84 TaxID=1168544 RepID=A0A9P4L3Y6_9PLEO|nr:kinase-like protein [Cucurbitaria berberidis CBS 394.84]KAF1840293.1 kinase-like protein [Cucurbitaria berberidis CBS 394.84]